MPPKKQVPLPLDLPSNKSKANQQPKLSETEFYYDEDVSPPPAGMELYYNAEGDHDEEDNVDASPVYGNGMPNSPGAGTIRVYHYQDVSQSSAYYDNSSNSHQQQQQQKSKEAASKLNISIDEEEKDFNFFQRLNTWLRLRPLMLLLLVFLLTILTASITSYVVVILTRVRNEEGEDEAKVNDDGSIDNDFELVDTATGAPPPPPKDEGTIRLVDEGT